MAKLNALILPTKTITKTKTYPREDVIAFPFGQRPKGFERSEKSRKVTW